jgi:DNA-binding NarL/FixJ family response regulator
MAAVGSMSTPGNPGRGVAGEQGPGRPVRVLIVDDDPLVRAGLGMMLGGADGIEVVAEAADGDQVEAAADAHIIDVVLMDIRMQRVDGIEGTRRLRRRAQPPEVIVLTTFDADELVLRALRAGASGYLLKDTPPERIVDAIRRVAGGDPILAPAITRKLMSLAVADHQEAERARRALDGLTSREREVVLAIAAGKSNAELAGDLYLSVATVKMHVSRILAKLGLDNRTQIALLAHDADLT